MYTLFDTQAGSPAIGVISQPDSTQREIMGAVASASDPWWGGGEFVYGYANGTIRQYGLCVVTQTLQAAGWTNPISSATGPQQIRWDFTEVPNTANLGRSLYVAMFPMIAGQYGWFMRTGTVPVNCQASVAADTTFGIAAAGQGGANGAGKQVLNARVVLAGSTTVVKANVNTTNGSSFIYSPNGTDGWFPGAFISGTGIPASTIVGVIDPDSKRVQMFQSGTTTPQNATATGAVSVTATYNNATIFYNVAHIDRPIAQGAIT